ncbi:MAG TPA: hypothetical protein VFU31_25520 [Candidatus Binatia bacterium]|nr:hypothetical protein [Candidatus Binatia bacterium]
MAFGRYFGGFFLLAVLGLAGCHELGHVDGLGDYGNAGGELAGEIAYVDTRAREIELRADSGRTSKVKYDNRTKVIYRQREHVVADLEPGDYVAMRTQQDRDGRLYTDLITVRDSVQERGGYGGSGRADRFETVEGRVQHIDARRGTFEIRNRSNRAVVVLVPYNPPRPVSDRFNRLREGDHVRLEGRFIGEGRFEMENFL